MGPRTIPRPPGGSACRLAVLALAGCVAAAASGVHALPEHLHGTVTWVTDGDTLWFQPEAGTEARKLRLQGIDAPEICQAGGVAAREALQRLALHRRVRVEVLHHDDYGRGLARVQLDSEDLGAMLVREGWAWSYRFRGDDGPYAALQRVARRQQRGLWADPWPERPRDFRQRHGSCHSPG